MLKPFVPIVFLPFRLRADELFVSRSACARLLMLVFVVFRVSAEIVVHNFALVVIHKAVPAVYVIICIAIVPNITRRQSIFLPCLHKEPVEDVAFQESLIGIVHTVESVSPASQRTVADMRLRNKRVGALNVQKTAQGFSSGTIHKLITRGAANTLLINA